MKIGIHKVGDLRKHSAEGLEQWLGRDAEGFLRLAHGIDNRPVVSDREAKSIGQEQTFGVDTFQLTPSLVDPTQTTTTQQSARLTPTARLTIGKRISERIYFTFSRSLNTTINDQIILIEYDESERMSWVLSRNEDDQTYALEFRVRHVF